MEEYKSYIRKILVEELTTFDSELFNFLIRRVRIEIRNLGTDWYDDKKLEVTEYKFEGFPGYGFNSFLSKKEATYKILKFLVEIGLIGDDIFLRGQSLDTNHQKIMRTIKKFLDYIEFDKK